MYTEYFNVLPCLQLMTYILLKCIIHTANLIPITILNFTLHHFSPPSQKPKNISIHCQSLRKNPHTCKTTWRFIPHLTFIAYCLATEASEENIQIKTIYALECTFNNF